MNEFPKQNKALNLIEALTALLVVIILLSINIFFAEGVLFERIFKFLHASDFIVSLGTDYSNQLILLTGALVGVFIGYFNQISLKEMFSEIWLNLKQTSGAIIILALVGALSGTWLISGIIPAMIYYGLQILNPSIFLPATLIITSVISLATGSSWTTSATVGIALIGIGSSLGIDTAMIAGAVISGAYFGDKMSPLSDTTNLAPAMAGTDLFTHIRYMTYTTIPSYIIAFIVFVILSFTIEPKGEADISIIVNTIQTHFNINLWLFLVPLAVIVLVFLKAKPYIAILAGVILASLFALIFQQDVLAQLAENGHFSLSNALKVIAKAILVENAVETGYAEMNDLV